MPGLGKRISQQFDALRGSHKEVTSNPAERRDLEKLTNDIGASFEGIIFNAERLLCERDELLEIARSIVEFQGHITTHMRRRIEAAIANYEV